MSNHARHRDFLITNNANAKISKIIEMEWVVVKLEIEPNEGKRSRMTLIAILTPAMRDRILACCSFSSRRI